MPLSSSSSSSPSPLLDYFLFPSFLSSLFLSSSFSLSSPLDMLGRVREADTDLLDDDDGGKSLLLVVVLPQLSREDAVNPNPNPDSPRPDRSLGGGGGGCGCGRPRRAVEREERGGGDRGEQGRRLNAFAIVRRPR